MHLYGYLFKQLLLGEMVLSIFSKYSVLVCIIFQILS